MSESILRITIHMPEASQCSLVSLMSLVLLAVIAAGVSGLERNSAAPKRLGSWRLLSSAVPLAPPHAAPSPCETLFSSAIAPSPSSSILLFHFYQSVNTFSANTRHLDPIDPN
jgi:hypothetical protein